MLFRKLCIIFLFVLSSLNLASATEVSGQCYIERPKITSITHTPKNIDDIIIKAKKTSAVLNGTAKFDGDVFFQQYDKSLTANHATYNQNTGILKAQGNVKFQSNDVIFTAEKLNVQINTEEANLEKTKYWLVSNNLHGSAQTTQIKNENSIDMKEATFSSCPDDAQVWNVDSNEVNFDQEMGWVDFWGSTIEIYSVPIFYLPYFTAPTSDKRKSGLLHPTYSESNIDGFTANIPIYWNIAPNYDATLTPSIITERGTFLKGEFRYLVPYTQGTIKAEKIESDRLYNNEKRNAWSISSSLKDVPKYNANLTYSNVSDDNYFNDLPSDVASKGTTTLTRSVTVGYTDKSWDTSVLAQDLKVLNKSKPYIILPRVTFNYRAEEIGQLFDFNLYNQNTLFKKHDSEDKTQRLHFEPALSLPLLSPSSSLTTEAKLYVTYYQQSTNNKLTEETNYITRSIPEFKTTGKLYFERLSSFFSIPYRQTLEPGVEYLYRDYRNQDDILLYDTGTISRNSASIFLDRKYSGLDRISNANQVTVKVGTGIFNQREQERSYASIGQIFYLEQNKVTLRPNQSLEEETHKSDYAAELRIHPVENWYFNTGILISEKTKDIKQANAALDYKKNGFQYFQLNYQRTPNKIEYKDISQVGSRVAFPITEKINTVARYYYDLIRKRSVDNFIGMEYNSCCWGIQLGYYETLEKKPDTPLGQINRGIQFSFNILGASDSRSKLFNFNDGKSLFNYNDPLYLND